MAENKKLNPDEVDAIESAIAAELSRNDDIVEYIQPSSLELLKARYAAVEEDESIRNEGFELAKKGGLIKKSRPENTAFEYFSTPVSPKDEIRTDVDSPLSQVFDVTKSEFDADTASFGDIDFEKPEVTEPETIEVRTASEETSAAAPAVNSTVNNRYGYDTHTRVIYYDESAEDGIKRNSEDELSSAFNDDTASKRRFGFWKKKRK